MQGFNRFDINEDIPAGKIVVLSLSGLTAEEAQHFSLHLIYANSGNELIAKGGISQSRTKMTYFKTVDSSNTRYYIYVNIDAPTTSFYTLNISVLDSTSFAKCDTKEQASSGNTYLISDWPEMLNSADYKGDEGYCLQRSRVEGNANIYWEHWNLYKSEMKFGVLLYNNNDIGVKVTLNRRCFSDNSSGETVLNDIWKGWLNKDKVVSGDESGFSSSVEIPPNGFQWICLYTVPYKSWGVIFNGVVDISIQSGYSLLCDTYIMEPTKVNQAELYVKKPKTATCLGTGDKLRGSGPSAMLISNEGIKSISPGKPYRLAITGYNMPKLNNGELIGTSDDPEPPTKPIEMENCYNYGVVYKLNFEGYKGGNIKGQVRYNTKLNPNYPGNIYVIVQKVLNDGAVDGSCRVEKPQGFLLKTSGSTTETFDANVPEGKVTYYIVVNSMSCMPLEVCFTNG